METVVDMCLSPNQTMPLIPSQTWNEQGKLSKYGSLAVFVLLILFFIKSSKRLADDLPRARIGWPILGNFSAWAKDPTGSLKQARELYGPVFKVSILPGQDLASG
jgi:hypothetical protein